MGRHSASYFEAQQTLFTGPPAVGAARYVGRVGALALAMGVGAAVAGGGGLARADGTTDNDTGGGAPAQSSPDHAADEVASADSPTGSSDVITRKPNSTAVPKMQGLSGGVPTDAQRAAEASPDSLAGLISRIPKQIASVFGVGGVPGANSPTPGKPAPQVSNRSSDRPAIEDQPSTADDAIATFAPAATDNHVTALPSGAQPLGVVPSTTADTTPQRRLIASSVTTTAPESTTGFAAPAQPARTQAAPLLANPIATVVSGFLSALGFSPTASTGDTPTAPIPLVLGVLHLIGREIDRIFAYQPPSTASFTSAEAYANANPAIASAPPSPGDEVHTAYGDVGKWMLQSNGQIANYGGQPFEGRTVLEPVNVIIVDPRSKTSAEAAQRLNAAMFWAGFPAQPIHSTGFQGEIDDVTYGQQPTGLLAGFSNNFFLVDNDHGRIFGPDPVETSSGYVWTGAFSRETLVFDNFLPGHAYVSSDVARTALATQLILSGQATFVGMVPLDNAYNTESTTTGDHDGYAVVLRLK